MLDSFSHTRIPVLAIRHIRFAIAVPFLPIAATLLHSLFVPSAMSDSTPVSFVPLVDAQPAPPLEPSLIYSFCGTRGRAIRCAAIMLLVMGVAAVGCYFNFTKHADRAVDDDDRSAFCDEWVNQYHIIPDATTNCPITTKLRVIYNNTAVPFASQLDNSCSLLTYFPPTVELPAALTQPNHSYAFALLDVDFPTPTNASLRSRTHHLVVNIPGGQSPLPLHRGDTLFNYTLPCPPTAGWHRYVALVYDQGRVGNVTLASRNVSGVPPVLMNIDAFLSLLVGADMTQTMEGGTFWYGQSRP